MIGIATGLTAWLISSPRARGDGMSCGPGYEEKKKRQREKDDYPNCN